MGAPRPHALPTGGGGSSACKRIECYYSVCHDVPRPANQQASRKKKRKEKNTDDFLFFASARRCFANDDLTAFEELGRSPKSSTADANTPNLSSHFLNR